MNHQDFNKTLTFIEELAEMQGFWIHNSEYASSNIDTFIIGLTNGENICRIINEEGKLSFQIKEKNEWSLLKDDNNAETFFQLLPKLMASVNK